jgi:hypothetical protein
VGARAGGMAWERRGGGRRRLRRQTLTLRQAGSEGGGTGEYRRVGCRGKGLQRVAERRKGWRGRECCGRRPVKGEGGEKGSE